MTLSNDLMIDRGSEKYQEKESNKIRFSRADISEKEAGSWQINPNGAFCQEGMGFQ